MTLFKSPNLISKLKIKRELLTKLNFSKYSLLNLKTNQNYILRSKLSIHKLTLSALCFSYLMKSVQSRKSRQKKILNSLHHFLTWKKKFALGWNGLNYSKDSLFFGSTHSLRYKIAIKNYILVYVKLLKKIRLKSFGKQLQLNNWNNWKTKFNSFFRKLKDALRKLKDALINLKIRIFSKIKDLFSKIKDKIKDLFYENGKFSLKTLNINSKIFEYLKRLLIVVLLYSLPFFLLAKHSIITGIPLVTVDLEESGGQEICMIVNSFFLRIFSKIPYFLPLFKKVLAILSENESLGFWMLYFYYLIFPANYKSLKIPYEIAYNGTVAFAFLSFQYALELLQDFILYPFDLFFAVHQTIAYMEQSKRIPARFYFRKLYRNLDKVVPFDKLSKKFLQFEDMKFIISQFIISPLVFVTLCALVYNCVYYVLKKKNPQILLISKTVSRTMVESKDDLF